MRKLFLSSLLFLFLTNSAFGAGSVSINKEKIYNQGLKCIVITLSWTADADDSTVPDAILTPKDYEVEGFYLYSVATKPGDPAPTNGYDIVIQDSFGIDLAGTKLEDRSSSAGQLVNLGLSSGLGFSVINSNLTVKVSNNSVKGAKGTIVMIFVPNYVRIY